MGKTQSAFLNLYNTRVERKDLFNEGELFRMKKMLSKIAGDKPSTISFEQLRDYLQPNMHSTMIQRLFTAMCWEHEIQKSIAEREKRTLLSPVAFYYVIGHLIKGNALKKAVVIRYMCGKRSAHSVTGLELFSFVKDLLTDHLQHVSCNEISTKFHEQPEKLEFTTENLAFALLHNAFHSGASAISASSWQEMPVNTEFNNDQVAAWLEGTSIILHLLNQMMLAAFPIRTAYTGGFQSFLPRFLQMDTNPIPQSMLDTPSIIFLNYHIPNFTEERHEWMLLHYSEKPEDRTFDQIVSVCLSHDNTLIIVEDSNNYRFGGFSSDKWSIYPKYRGSKGCFVFSLIPFMGIYNSTGVNRNWIYLNTVTFDDTLHCLAFGGNLDFFAFSIHGDCSSGVSYPSLTFSSPQLASTTKFTVTKLEIWAVLRTISPTSWRKKSSFSKP